MIIKKPTEIYAYMGFDKEGVLAIYSALIPEVSPGIIPFVSVGWGVIKALREHIKGKEVGNMDESTIKLYRFTNAEEVPHG